MQAHVAQPDLLKKRNVALCLVLFLCTLPLFLPFITLLHANEVVVPSARNDADGDLVVNTADIDDDNDGIPDEHELTPTGSDQDSDGDGMPDRLDLDSDNDGILDWQESGAIKTLNLSSLRKVGGRLVGTVGANGLLDVFESPVDTGRLAYTLGNTDVNQDDIPDFLDLDSDNDGWPDIMEAGVARRYDVNNDGRIDAEPGTVGNDGIADYLQQINDRACCDLDGDGADDIIPVNTDRADLPDFQDLDSDNDGVRDIIELGGTDTDNNGYVDNFVDAAGGPDGMDDGLLAFRYQPRDQNGNGVFDHVEFIGSVESGNPGAPDPESQQPLPDTLNDPSQGEVRTGLSASGCSVSAGSDKHFLLLLMLFSVAVILRRSLKQKGLMVS